MPGELIMCHGIMMNIQICCPSMRLVFIVNMFLCTTWVDLCRGNGCREGKGNNNNNMQPQPATTTITQLLLLLLLLLLMLLAYHYYYYYYYYYY